MHAPRVQFAITESLDWLWELPVMEQPRQSLCTGTEMDAGSKLLHQSNR